MFSREIGFFRMHLSNKICYFINLKKFLIYWSFKIFKILHTRYIKKVIKILKAKKPPKKRSINQNLIYIKRFFFFGHYI